MSARWIEHGGHPSAEELESFVLGACSSASEIEALEKHASSCERCAAEVATGARLELLLMTAVERAAAAGAVRSPRTLRPAAAAAGIVVVLAAAAAAAFAILTPSTPPRRATEEPVATTAHRLSDSVETVPGTAGAPPLPTTDDLYRKGRAAYESERFDRAQRLLEAAVQADPRNAEVRYWLGQTLLAQDSIYEAIGEFEQAVRLDSHHTPALRALGRASLERNQFRNARKWFEQYAAAAPEDHTIWIDVGDSFAEEARDDEALREYEKAIALGSKSARALLRIAEIWAKRDNLEELLRYSELAIAAEPENAEAQCFHALVLSTLEASGARGWNDVERALERCASNANASRDQREAARSILAARRPDAGGRADGAE